MDRPLDHIMLGKAQAYVSQYDSSLLQAVPRSVAREGIATQAPYGVDIWTGYELSWLNAMGIPQVAVAEFEVPATSPNLIESKSFKYYLNSFNQSVYPSWDAVRETMVADLSRCAGGPVRVHIMSLKEFAAHRQQEAILVDCIDNEADGFEVASSPSKALLRAGSEGCPEGAGGAAGLQRYSYCSHLLRSNCPVTGQPDWASVWFGWEGQAVTPASLLSYIVSFREHQGFHENCVETIYSDLWSVIQPSSLWVYARYTRRGGLDINPLRSSQPMPAPRVAAIRQ